MQDWIGILFFTLLALGIFGGLKILAKPQTRTEEEFERRAAEEKTMLGGGINALHKILDTGEARAAEVKTQIKEGRYKKKKQDGKLNGTDLKEEYND